MTTIIAGRFELQDDAQRAAAELARAGFPAERISVFYVSPAGQHDQTAIGGDRDQSPGAEGTGKGNAAGIAAGGAIGAAVGAVTAPLTGPIGAITGAFVGGHMGQLVGAMGATKDDGGDVGENRIPVRQAGMLVAVEASGAQDRAVDALRAVGAADLEIGEGNIVAGDWQDFDPVAPPRFIDQQTRTADRPHAEGAGPAPGTGPDINR
ncbi:MAG: hypothetical protein ACJ8G3_08715 [Burkholderiaceae bacterium]